jgi:hypothetical protein
MRTEFEELDAVPVEQEKEIEGYFDRRAAIIWGLAIVIGTIGFIRWNVC